jgi:hypothetical protein
MNGCISDAAGLERAVRKAGKRRQSLNAKHGFPSMRRRRIAAKGTDC